MHTDNLCKKLLGSWYTERQKPISVCCFFFLCGTLLKEQDPKFLFVSSNSVNPEMAVSPLLQYFCLFDCRISIKDRINRILKIVCYEYNIVMQVQLIQFFWGQAMLTWHRNFVKHHNPVHP